MNGSEGSLPGQTADELIAIAQANGFSVSKRQLAEWHRAGYLPTPQLLPRQRGTGPGKISVYPLGTSNQLLAYCEAHQQRRRLPEAAWTQWWEHGGTPEKPVRAFLKKVADAWSHRTDIVLGEYAGELVEGKTLSDDAQDHLLDLVDKGSAARKLSPIAAQARKRFRDGRFGTFLRILVEVATGTFAGYSIDAVTGKSEDRQIIDTGLGLGTKQPAATGKVPGRRAHPPYQAVVVDIDSEASLTNLMHVLEAGEIERTAEIASDDELVQAREEVRTFLEFAETFGPISEQILGHGLLGLSALGQAASKIPPFEQGLFVLLWRALRWAGFSDNMDTILAAMRQWDQVWLPTFRQLQQLRMEVPAFSEILAPQQTAKALRSERAMKQTLSTLQELYAQHQEEVQAFWVKQHGQVDAEHKNDTASTSVPEGTVGE